MGAQCLFIDISVPFPANFSLHWNICENSQEQRLIEIGICEQNVILKSTLNFYKKIFRIILNKENSNVIEKRIVRVEGRGGEGLLRGWGKGAKKRRDCIHVYPE